MRKVLLKNPRLILAACLTLFALSASAQTLDTVRERGAWSAAPIPGLAGFGLPDERGQWRGFDIDIAALSPPRFSAIPTRSNSCRCRARTASPPCNRAKWTCCRATPPGPNRARRGRGFVRRYQLFRRPELSRPQNLGLDSAKKLSGRLGLRAAGHDERTQSRRLFPPIGLQCGDRWCSRPPTKRSRPMIPAAATPSRPMVRRSTPRG